MNKLQGTDQISVARSDLRLVFWSYVVLAGLAMFTIMDGLVRVVRFETAVAALVFVLGIAFYPVWRLWTSARGRPVPFLKSLRGDLLATVIAYALAWLSRPLH